MRIAWRQICLNGLWIAGASLMMANIAKAEVPFFKASVSAGTMPPAPHQVNVPFASFSESALDSAARALPRRRPLPRRAALPPTPIDATGLSNERRRR